MFKKEEALPSEVREEPAATDLQTLKVFRAGGQVLGKVCGEKNESLKIESLVSGKEEDESHSWTTQSQSIWSV